MPPFTRRALYSAAQKKLQREARSSWRRSALGKVIEDVRRESRQSQRASGKLESALEQFKRGGLSGTIGALGDTSLNGLVQDVIRYSRTNKSLVDQFLRQLGPAGKVISAIASAVGTTRRKPTTGDRDVDAARELLEAFGMQVSPSSRHSPAAKSVAAAKEFLEQNGYEVKPVGNKLETVPAPSPAGGGAGAPTGGGGGRGGGSGGSGGGGTGEEPPERPSGGDNMVEVPFGTGTRKFPKDHPIVTKKAIKTPQSSNVWSFVYDIDSRTLYILFDAPKTKANPSKRPGALYSYSNVGPDVFLAMMKAESKGGFVWDRIRIRGTASGHRYSYALVAVREGYVPRKATLTPAGEYWVKRKISTINKQGVRKTLVSKPTAPVSAFGRGTPNRGAPNRGRPNRGR